MVTKKYLRMAFILLFSTVTISLYIGVPRVFFEAYYVRGQIVNRYFYDIVVMGESYKIGIETDGTVSGLENTNYTFSISWESFGTFENITMPKTLNNTNIKVMYEWMIQGWSTPIVTANETHYFVSAETDMTQHIVWVCFGEPSIQMDISAPTVSLGYYVNITGTVTYRKLPVNDVGVYIGWSSGGLLHEISMVKPSSDGTFKVSWMPQATGTFYVHAVLTCSWLPDEVPRPEVRTCLSISLPVEQPVFSVVSNSTISPLTYNSTANILSFSAMGPNGTKGYAKVFISKNLLTNINDLQVFVDGNLTDYTYTSTQKSWTIKIFYTHSTHEIQVVIPEYSSIAIILPFILTSIATILFKK